MITIERAREVLSYDPREAYLAAKRDLHIPGRLVENGANMKECIKCKEALPLSAFYPKSKYYPSVLKARCKVCTLQRTYELSMRAPGERGNSRERRSE